MSHNELDKLTRFFIQKSSQVIVQSRLGSERIQTRSNPRGKDWFSLSIPDDKEVTDRTRKCLDTIATEFEDKTISVTRNWNVCCEVSLKTSDDVCMVLEYWLFSNESLITTSTTQRTRVTVPPEEVFTFYNRLTLLLKSIITLTRATPIHKISRSGQGPDTFVICYRIFDTTGPIDNLIEEKDKNKYSRVTKLGTVSSQFNRVAVTFSYRTNMATCNEDKSQSGPLLPVKMDHFKPDSPDPDADFSCSRKILAFASPKKSGVDASILVPENAFMSLLAKKPVIPEEEEEGKDAGVSASPTQESKQHQSEPQSGDMSASNKLKSGSGSRVSASEEESFVFVEAPFASPEEKVLGSFFNGPSPGFADSEKLPLQLNELTAEIEAIESSVQQWDSFVESVCSPDCGESIMTQGDL